MIEILSGWKPEWMLKNVFDKRESDNFVNNNRHKWSMMLVARGGGISRKH